MPNADFDGGDSFTYTVTDLFGRSATGVVIREVGGTIRRVYARVRGLPDTTLWHGGDLGVAGTIGDFVLNLAQATDISTLKFLLTIPATRSVPSTRSACGPRAIRQAIPPECRCSSPPRLMARAPSRFGTFDAPVGNVTHWVYDDSGRTVTETRQGVVNGVTTTVSSVQTLDLLGRVTEAVDADGRERDFTYNLDGTKASETWYALQGDATPIESFHYTYADGLLFSAQTWRHNRATSTIKPAGFPTPGGGSHVQGQAQ